MKLFIKEKLAPWLLTAAMVLTVTGIPVRAAEGKTNPSATGDLTVTGGTVNTDYSYDADAHTLTVKTATPLTISGTTTQDHIIIQDGTTANITLDNANIQFNDGTSAYPFAEEGTCAFELAGNANCNLTLKGSNILKSGYFKAGLKVADSNSKTAHLTVSCWKHSNEACGKDDTCGKLDVQGGIGSAGIGGNAKINQEAPVSCGTIVINSGIVTATGGSLIRNDLGPGSGIGGGCYGDGGTVTINGGTVKAVGGGDDSSGIGGSFSGTGGTVTINSGNVTALGGSMSHGIGSKKNLASTGTFSTGTNGNAFIIASSISDKTNQTNWQGVIITENTGKVYGTPTLTNNAEIPDGNTLEIEAEKSLTIDNGVTFTNNGTLANNGTLINHGTLSIKAEDTLTGNGTLAGDGIFKIQALDDPKSDDIIVPQALVYNGENQTQDVKDLISIDIDKTNTINILGKDFLKKISSDGWTLDITALGAVKDVGTYTAKFTNGGNEIQKTFTVAPKEATGTITLSHIDSNSDKKINYGDVLKADSSLITPTGGTPSFQWKKTTDGITSNIGSDDAFYTLTPEDKKGSIFCIVTYTGNTTGTIQSNSVTIAEQAPAVTPPVASVPKLSSIKLNVSKKTLGVKEKYTLKVAANPKKAKLGMVSYKSGNKKIAKVNAKGQITALKPGKTKITVTAEGKKATCTITVKKAPKKVSLKASKKTLRRKKTLKLKVILSKGSSGSVTFSSSNKKIATVNKQGIVKGLKKGKVKIKVKTYNKKTAFIKLTIK